jgi:predicted AAA+ superfamily ATPase
MDKIFLQRDFAGILKAVEAICDKPFHTKNSLIFFDEIQATPAGLAALRLFYDQTGDFIPVIAAGSLLEFVLAEYTYSMPVGRIEYLHMGPMKFQEFLEALGHHILMRQLEDFRLGDPINPVTHKKLIGLTREYLAVGGMPEAVGVYARTKSLKDVQACQQFIIDTFRDDFFKYGRKIDVKTLRILRSSFDFVPFHVGQKIKYSKISAEDKAESVRKSLDLLCLARVIQRITSSSCNGLPLASQVNPKIFKCLFLDVGLMNRRCGVDWAALSKLDDIRLVDEGKIAEQFVGQELLYDADGVAPPELFFWQRDEKSSASEVDYILTAGARILPVEVKSGKTGSMKSLHRFLYEKKLRDAIRFDLNPPSQGDFEVLTNGQPVGFKLHSLPIYMAGMWKRLFE